MKKALISGSLAFDRIMDFDGNFSDHFMKDKLHAINVSFLVHPPEEMFGGCAGNIAYNLSLLGAPSDIHECAGKDFEPYRVRLMRSNIGTDTIHVFDDVPTASAYIMTDRADNQITAFSEGASARTYEKKLLLSNYEIVMLGTASVPNSIALARAANAAGVPYYFDPSQKLTAFPSEVVVECIKGAAGLFVNDYEFELVLRATKWSESDILSHIPLLVVTLGEQGSRVVTKEKETHVPAVRPARVVDPTGAGDAFRAGFLKGTLAGLTHELSAELGATVASYAVETYGTQNHRFTLDELRERYLGAYGHALVVS